MTDPQFAKKQATIAENVKRLAANRPEVRSDYRLLIQYYHFYIDGLNAFVPLDVLRGLTQPESITRAYRKLVEAGEIVPEPKVQAARRDQERKFKGYYRKGA